MALDDATFTAIMDRVSNGELVTDVCADYGIPRNAVWRYCEEGGEAARTAYTRARVSQAHSLAEVAVLTSRSTRGMTADGIAGARLEVDTLKWLTTKIAPRLYGDRLDVQAVVAHTVTGVIALPDEDAPLPRTTVTAALLTSPSTRGDEPQAVDAQPLTPADLTQHVSVCRSDTCQSDTAGEGVGGGDGAGTGGVDARP